MNTIRKLLSAFGYNCNGDSLKISVENDGVIVFRREDGVLVRELHVDEIRAVGYMTSEPSVCGYDYFLLINASDTTYCLPVDWPNVAAVIGFLRKRLPGYNASIGLANSLVSNTLTVYPREKSGDKFTFMSNVYPEHLVNNYIGSRE